MNPLTHTQYAFVDLCGLVCKSYFSFNINLSQFLNYFSP